MLQLKAVFYWNANRGVYDSISVQLNPDLLKQ